MNVQGIIVINFFLSLAPIFYLIAYPAMQWYTVGKAKVLITRYPTSVSGSIYPTFESSQVHKQCVDKYVSHVWLNYLLNL